MSSKSDLLEKRLIDFGVGACRLVRRIQKDIVGAHVAQQLARSATSPAANYAEACGAESKRDFVHKIQICLKELLETSIWLRLADRTCGGGLGLGSLIQECNELISIFVASTKTAKAKTKPANL